MIDLGIFFGEYLIAKRPQLYWSIDQGSIIEPASFRAMSYRRPIIVGFPRGWIEDALTKGYGLIAQSHVCSKIGHSLTLNDPDALVRVAKSALYLANMPDRTVFMGDSSHEQL
jgi:hypothetical protein